MIGRFCFKAQALDNNSPDQYQVDGKLLSDNEQQPRLVVTALISKIARNGDPVLNERGVEIIVFGPQFLVQLYSEERDTVGRRAPIVGCGTGDPARDGPIILHALEDFARKIGRTLDPEHVHRFKMLSPSTQDAGLGRRIPLTLVLAAILLMAALALVALHLSQNQG